MHLPLLLAHTPSGFSLLPIVGAAFVLSGVVLLVGAIYRLQSSEEEKKLGAQLVWYSGSVMAVAIASAILILR